MLSTLWDSAYKRTLPANRKGVLGYQSPFCVYFDRGNNLESADEIIRKACLAFDKCAAQIMHIFSKT